MPSSWDPTWLLLSLLPSGAGFVLFVYGKKQARWAHLAAGIALMAYPYFATTLTSLVVGAAIISGAFYVAIQAGW